MAGEFHVVLASMTGNATLFRYVNELVARSSLFLALHGRPHSSGCTASEHRAILSALVSGNDQEAVQYMTEHLNAVTTQKLLTKDRGGNTLKVLAHYASAEGLL
ncbi:UNVERIFIED_ORG: FCD domain-containing protein (plasmid) [Roseateles sp. XES5]